jgi:hypothetical protein
MLSLRNRNSLPPAVAREFDQLVGRLNALLSVTLDGQGNAPSQPPVGSVVAFGRAASPSSRWLVCDGREVERLKYPQLFAVIGTTFGPGNGSTTFNLPDGTPDAALAVVYLILAQ